MPGHQIDSMYTSSCRFPDAATIYERLLDRRSRVETTLDWQSGDHIHVQIETHDTEVSYRSIRNRFTYSMIFPAMF